MILVAKDHANFGLEIVAIVEIQTVDFILGISNHVPCETSWLIMFVGNYHSVSNL